VSSANRGECVTRGGLYRPTHLCVAHFKLHKKSFRVFFHDVVRLGRGGCEMVHVSGGRGFVWDFREGRGEPLHHSPRRRDSAYTFSAG